MVPAKQSSSVHLARNSAKTFIVQRDELPDHINRCRISSIQCRTAIATGTASVVRIPKGGGRGIDSAINGVKEVKFRQSITVVTLVIRIVALYSKTHNPYPELVLSASFVEQVHYYTPQHIGASKLPPTILKYLNVFNTYEAKLISPQSKAVQDVTRRVIQNK